MRCVRAAGGEVHTNVPIRGILCEEDEDGKMQALGVRLCLDEEESSGSDGVEETTAGSSSSSVTTAISSSSSSIKGVVSCSQVIITPPPPPPPSNLAYSQYLSCSDIPIY